MIEDGVFVGQRFNAGRAGKAAQGILRGGGFVHYRRRRRRSLAIGRSRQIVKEGWAKQKRAGTAAKG